MESFFFQRLSFANSKSLFFSRSEERGEREKKRQESHKEFPKCFSAKYPPILSFFSQTFFPVQISFSFPAGADAGEGEKWQFQIRRGLSQREGKAIRILCRRPL